VSASFCPLALGTDTVDRFGCLRLLRHRRHEADVRSGKPVCVTPLAWSLDLRPMTQTVEDNAIVLEVIAGAIRPTLPVRTGRCRATARR